MRKYLRSKRLLTFICVVFVLFSALSLISAALPERTAGAPVVVEPKDAREVLSVSFKAKPGTVAGNAELKDSGELVSMTVENDFTVTFYLPPDNTDKLHVVYTTDNGKSETLPGLEFHYLCSTPEDYTTLHVQVYSEKNELVKEYTFTVRFEEPGFWKKLFWSFRGNETVGEVIDVLKTQIPLAVWETFYVTILSSLIAFLLGLPLGVLLVTGDKNGIRPLPGWIMSVLNFVINILRSIPFLILMILVIPVSRAIVGTSVGTVATIVPLVFAAFPFVARLVESSLRELNPNIIEAAQSMGASPIQIIMKVMIPESVPSLVSNMTIAVTTILGYSAMSGVIGGGGLGKIAIDYGYYRYQFPTMVVAVVLLVLLVQVFQTVGTKLAKKLDKRLK